jgi:RNA polymerase sigma factor, sigma-70 family
MPGRRLRLDVFTEVLGSTAAYRMTEDGEREKERNRSLYGLILNAAGGELTARQLQCLRMYYFEERNMVEIAESTGVSVPTVSRHLKKARERLFQIAVYAYPQLSTGNKEVQ